MNEEFAEHCREAAGKLAGIGIVPVLVLRSGADALKLCEILVRHGLAGAEITFRTPEAADVIRTISTHFPELYLGAGTVLNAPDLHRAIECGAKFAVSPGLNPDVVKAAVKCGFPFAPGICTPSEIEQACSLGCRLLKFFPAEAAGGAAMLKAMSAPYRHLNLKFMPTGGITAANAADYLNLNCVCAAGGTYLCKEADLASGNWKAVEQRIAAAAGLIRSLNRA